MRTHTTSAGRPTNSSVRILGTLGLLSWAACLVYLVSSSALGNERGDLGPYAFLAEITLVAVLAFTASAFPTVFRSASALVTLAGAGALGTLVILGLWTIGIGILPAALFFLSAGVLHTIRSQRGAAVSIVAFVSGVVAECLFVLAIHSVLS